MRKHVQAVTCSTRFSESSAPVLSSAPKALGTWTSSFLRLSRMLELHPESCFTDASSAKELSTIISKEVLYINTVLVLIPWRHGHKLQEDLGRVRTKPGDSVTLVMSYDEGVIKGRSQLLWRYFEPVLFSNKMHWFHLYRVLVGDIADAWVPKLAPRYGDHELNWWMITQNLALYCSS